MSVTSRAHTQFLMHVRKRRRTMQSLERLPRHKTKVLVARYFRHVCRLGEFQVPIRINCLNCGHVRANLKCHRQSESVVETPVRADVP